MYEYSEEEVMLKFHKYLKAVATLEQFEASNHLENRYLLEQLVSNSMKLQWEQVIVQKQSKVNLKDWGTWAIRVHQLYVT
ncbi:hypothetical protein JTB14_028221 [Gonioctena quinquepunctata]|nr:hypothetical protein JTB14_028221 [Gonioctena quinquepunctata]